MKVLAYNPDDDSFFVGTTFHEFLRLEKKYKVESVGIDIESAKRLIEEETKFVLTEGASFYFDVIKNMYEIDTVPDICFVAYRDLSLLELEAYDFPFCHMWNAYSPWIHIKIIEINDLRDLVSLQCEERVEDV